MVESQREMVTHSFCFRTVLVGDEHFYCFFILVDRGSGRAFGEALVYKRNSVIALVGIIEFLGKAWSAGGLGQYPDRLILCRELLAASASCIGDDFSGRGIKLEIGFQVAGADDAIECAWRHIHRGFRAGLGYGRHGIVDAFAARIGMWDAVESYNKSLLVEEQPQEEGEVHGN